MQIRQMVPNGEKLGHKTSSPDTQSLRVQMPDVSITAENDFVLATSTFSEVPVPYQRSTYQYQYPVQQDWYRVSIVSKPQQIHRTSIATHGLG